MAEILVRDIPSQTAEEIEQFAARNGLNLSEACVELLKIAIAADADLADLKAGDGLPVGDYVAQALKEALHTQDEAEEFIRNRQERGGSA